MRTQKGFSIVKFCLALVIVAFGITAIRDHFGNPLIPTAEQLGPGVICKDGIQVLNGTIVYDKVGQPAKCTK